MSYQGHRQVYTSTFAQLAAQGVTFSAEQEAALRLVLGNTFIHASDEQPTTEGNYLCVLRNNHIVHVQGLKRKFQRPVPVDAEKPGAEPRPLSDFPELKNQISEAFARGEVDVGDGAELNLPTTVDYEELVFVAPMYPEPLTFLAKELQNTIPPTDMVREYVWVQMPDRQIDIRQALPGEVSNMAVTLYAGPNVDCYLPVVAPPEGATGDFLWRAALDRLVNELSNEFNSIVWWLPISAPPHYTKDMIGKT